MSIETFVNNSNDFLCIYAIFDKKLNKFMVPFFVQDEIEAIRQFKSLVNYSNSLIMQFPQDYELTFLGHYSLSDGEFQCDFVVVVQGSELIEESSIKFKNLLNEVQKQAMQVSSCINDFTKLQQEYEQKNRILDSKVNLVESVELYEPKKELKQSKKTILKRLFH